MKETIFRGKRIDNGEWVYGSYHYCNKEGIMRLVDYIEGNRVIEERPVHFNNHWILVHHTPDSQGWDVRDTFTPYDVIPETVGQYTGVDDKLGQQIFQDDIIKTPCALLDDQYNYTKVEYNNDVAAWVKKYDKRAFVRLEIRKEVIERIGNYHDNPELLNTE